ncbi:amidophosphoribosyltransferase [Candidatus Magnetaquiglobus chichijimensis]|uniref:amidophosphoribosyltransferase n=1 Tax=Candidatus Magnetaquiglobus chichijimensis TaxID=3141448 RepID=UPI003B974F86
MIPDDRTSTLDLLLDDHFHDECGVFGIYNHPEAANLVYLGLYALQHRGQESAGIVSVEDRLFQATRGHGLVADVFRRNEMESLRGSQAIGHVRYSTSGGSVNSRNRQPLVVDTAHGGMAMAHNGNLVNAVEMRRALERRGSIFQSTMDTEVIVHLTALSRHRTFAERLVEALGQVSGSYALLAMDEHGIIGARDPHGLRPLVIGRVGNGYVFSSETCALNLIEAEFIRDVEPGEVVVIGPHGIESFFPFPRQKRCLCVFEYIYFARPDSNIDGVNVYASRKRIGMRLAQEYPVPEADLVIPVPDSGVPAALGFAHASGTPFELGIIRNHYVGRTFIEPQQSIRHFGVKIKLNANPHIIKDKHVVLVDDSIVRGTTSRKIVKMVRAAGAKSVHLRISSPPTTHPCFYGIDTPTQSELLASSHTVEEMRTYVTADSLAFLSLDGLYAAVNGNGHGYCDACFSGHYPIPFPRQEENAQLSLLQES